MVGRLYGVVVAHIVLSEAFHIVHIHTHHVAQSVRHKHSVSACCHRVVGVTLHQSKVLESFGHEAAYCHMSVVPAQTGLGKCESQVVAIGHDLHYVTLFLSKSARDRHCASVVAAIVFECLSPGVHKQQATRLESHRRRTAVHNLAVHGYDVAKRYIRAERTSYTFYYSADISLSHTGLGNQLHSGSVHLIAYGCCTLEFGYFFLALD